jgi:hypothetical protein
MKERSISKYHKSAQLMREAISKYHKSAQLMREATGFAYCVEQCIEYTGHGGIGGHDKERYHVLPET